jgi:hypothetical protein
VSVALFQSREADSVDSALLPVLKHRRDLLVAAGEQEDLPPDIRQHFPCLVQRPFPIVRTAQKQA